MLGILPTETLLEILAYLPLSDLHAVQATCKAWNQLVQSNEEYLCWLLLWRTGLGHDDATKIDVAKGHHALAWLDSAHTWKELGRRRYLLDRSWLGKGKAVVRSMTISSRRVHRFKVDEVERTVLLTTSMGGLTVADIATDNVLWLLPAIYVTPYTHIEYDSAHGFLAFNRSSHNIELWQRSTDSRHPRAQPSQLQSMVSYDSTQQGRGIMRPVAELHHSAHTRAFRMVYPTLLVASQEAGKAYVWDIPTLTCQEIDIGPGWFQGHEQWIHYVEVSEKHVFVCCATQVKVFNRDGGQCILAFPPDGGVFDSPAKRRMAAYTFERNPKTYLPLPDTMWRSMNNKPAIAISPCKLDRPILTVQEAKIAPLASEDNMANPELEDPDDGSQQLGFAAVHVSPDGRNFIAVHCSEFLYYVRDFAGGSGDIESRTSVLRFTGSAIRNLAFDGRRALVTTTKGVYILTLNGSNENRGRQADDEDVFSLDMVAPFTHREALSRLSCAQLTATALWITWLPSMRRFHITTAGNITQDIDLNRDASLIHYVDFTYVQP